jgi:hypothetical protein
LNKGEGNVTVEHDEVFKATVEHFGAQLGWEAPERVEFEFFHIG